MSRPSTTAAAPDRPTVERLLATAEEAHARASRELKEAKEQLAHASEKFYDGATAATRNGKRIAEEDLERASEIERRTSSSLEQARTALAKVERAEALAKYGRARDAVVAFQAGLAERGGVFVALDRQVDEAVVGVARELAEASEAYEHAERLADRLGLTGDLDRQCRRPTVAQLRLDVTRLVTKARLEEQRDPLAPNWLAQAEMKWPRDGMSAAEMEDHDAAAANLQAQARAAQVAQATTLGRLAGAQEAGAVPAPKTETVIHEGDDA